MTNNYLPFARKYRPDKFVDLKGQQVLVKSFSYSIINNKISQAYLLTGIRGVGKTSSARIIAKTINCTNPVIKLQDIMPCNLCKNCESFLKHNHPDIIEIDAASKTSVDDIRSIIDSCEYKPLIGKYKIFIIDEIHMLSKNAFNALLKIVEEPPKHVIFIFATTEVNKIPLTVISRCQRYDLRRLSFEEIFLMLKNITLKEALHVSDEALKIISIRSEGSARDATTILEQATNYIQNVESKSFVTEETVNNMLGLVSTSSLITILQHIVVNDAAGALNIVNDMYMKSINIELFLQELLNFISELTKLKLIKDYEIIAYTSFNKEVTQLLKGLSLSRLTVIWQILVGSLTELKHSFNHLIFAEMAVIKLIYACNIPTLEDIAKLDCGQLIIEPETSEIADEDQKNHGTKYDVMQDFFSFIRYCHEHKESAIYYSLLNEIEVISFSECVLCIKAINMSKKSVEELKLLLNSWSNQTWVVKIENTDSLTSLKQIIWRDIEKQEDFLAIKSLFPSANIVDIVFDK